MRVLVCGDRDWTGHQAMWDFIGTLSLEDVVIEGGARGADQLAGKYARARGIEVVVFPAQWGKYGKAAGTIRNQQMLDEGKPDRVVYFHDDLAASKGTRDMVNRATRAGITVQRG